jgi:maltose/maltodextrin transport system substrate-binding protein
MKKTTLALAISATSLMAASPAIALEEGKLLVWIGGDKGYNGLQEVGDRFFEDTGVEVVVEWPDNVTERFQQVAALGKGPDIFFWAHDRYGDWAEAGLIAPIQPSDEAYSSSGQFAWDAMSYKGDIYGYPLAVEAVGLLYNKELVSEVPSSWDEVIALDTKLKAQGKSAILWDYNNTYFTYGLLSAFGGYAFGQNDFGYVSSDLGVNNAGAIQGVKVLEQLITDGVMPEGAGYGEMDTAFAQGDVAMIINGPWSWGNYEGNGIDFGVAPLPSGGKPFVGVLGGVMNAASPNMDLAQSFMEEYLLTVEGLRAVNNDKPLGAVAHTEFMKELSADEKIAATFVNAEMGHAMPNIPEMSAFWSNMGPALSNVTSGRQSVEEALNDAYNRITGK